MADTRDSLIALRDAAAANAASLVQDAGLLLGAGRWAGAHGMATLALEEVGKAWLCHQKLVGLQGIRIKDLRTDHVHKAIAGRQLIALMEQAGQPVFDLDHVYGEHHDWAADDAHYLRLSGLYVDLTEDGVEGGAASVTEGQAAESVELAARGARAAATLSRWTLPDGPPGSDDRPVRRPLKPPSGH